MIKLSLRVAPIVLAALLSACVDPAAIPSSTTTGTGTGTGTATTPEAQPEAQPEASASSGGFNAGNIEDMTRAARGVGSVEDLSDTFADPTLVVESGDIIFFIDLLECDSDNRNCQQALVYTFWEPKELGRQSFSAQSVKTYNSNTRGARFYLDVDKDLAMERRLNSLSTRSRSTVRSNLRAFVSLAQKTAEAFSR